MHLLAPAKINLHLRVGARREDGFHPLLSWMTTVGLFDTLELEAEELRPERPSPSRIDGATADRAPVVLECDMPGLPCDERNLVVRIALAWRDALTHERRLPDAHLRGLQISLRKRIPMGAGLGGGSSDAARTLLGLNRLWKSGRAADELSAFAARFGSDLPFFFFGPSSVCQGRGEIVSPVARPAPRWAVLVLPEISMPTAEVYRRFDQMELERTQDALQAPDWREWSGYCSEDLLPRLVNDLEGAAFSIAPQLGALRAHIEDELRRPVRMSGSGSSLFTLFDERPQAHAAAEKIERVCAVRATVVEIAPIFGDDLNGSYEDK